MQSSLLAQLMLQMALAKSESGGALFSGPVVVLADRDKEEMDEEVRRVGPDRVMAASQVVGSDRAH